MTDLTDSEIDTICAGLVQNAAKVRYLRKLGLTVRQKPNGKPLVNRAHYDSVMLGGLKTATKARPGIQWSVAA